MEAIRQRIRAIPDFPKPGILFRDITPLLSDPHAMRQMMDYFKIRYKGRKIDKVVGIESRGFILGSAIAYMLGVGFVPVRKPGKLPGEKERVSYALEYGTDALEIHRDAILPGEKVLVVDDLLATGGTAGAACLLVENLGGDVVECAFLIALTQLQGKEKLKEYNIFTLLEY